MNHHPIINGDTRDYSSRDFLDAKTILEFLSVFDLYVKKNGKIDRIEIQSEIDIFGDRRKMSFIKTSDSNIQDGFGMTTIIFCQFQFLITSMAILESTQNLENG